MTDEVTPIIQNLKLLRDIVSEKVKLDEKGYGLCPFHDERTPSFHIFKATSGRARFYCFGCGAQGDIFNYLKFMDRLGFSSALAKLKDIPLSSSPENPASVSPIGDERFCENDCQRYTDLREDYNILLEENRQLRTRLGMDDFRPSNERQNDA